MQQEARHFHRVIKALYENIDNPPWKLQIREGQGIHVLFFSAPDHPLQAIITPNDIGMGGQWSSNYTSMYIPGTPNLSDDESEWVQRLHAAIKVLDENPQWQELVQWAMTRPGISVKSRKENVEGKETSGEELLVRIIEQCNAACDFCGCIGISSDYATREDSIRQRLQEGFDQGIRRVAFTGGEPTLVKALPDYVAWAKEIGFTWVNIQTNGVRLSDPSLTQRLAEAGTDSLLLSLHSHIPSIHDHILKLEGGFEQAIEGIRNSLESGINVGLNYVINRDNLEALPEYMEYVCNLWSSVENNKANRGVTVTLSFVSPVGWTLEHLELIPKLTDAAPKIAEALETAENWGVEAHIPGLCGVPICILPGYEKFFDEYNSINPARISTREYVDACDSCDYKNRCSGYWTEYFNIYGKDELGYEKGKELTWNKLKIEPTDELREIIARAFVELGITGEQTHAQVPLLEIVSFFEKERIPCPLPGRWSEKRCLELIEVLGIPKRFTAGSPPPEWLTVMVKHMKHMGGRRWTGGEGIRSSEQERIGRILDIKFHRQTIELLLSTGPDAQITLSDPKPRFQYTIEGGSDAIHELSNLINNLREGHGGEFDDRIEEPIALGGNRCTAVCKVASRKGRRSISRWVRGGEGRSIVGGEQSDLTHYLLEKGIKDLVSPVVFEANESGEIILLRQDDELVMSPQVAPDFIHLNVRMAEGEIASIEWTEKEEVLFQFSREQEDMLEQLFKELSHSDRDILSLKLENGHEDEFSAALFQYFTHGAGGNGPIPHWASWFSGRVVLNADLWPDVRIFLDECRSRVSPLHQMTQNGQQPH